MKNRYIIICILILSSMLGACSTERVYSRPTTNQVDEFIANESINVEAIAEADDFTVVLFQSGNTVGHYTLYQDKEGKLYDQLVVGSSLGVNPVCIGGVASGKQPFVYIIMNDEEIYDQASYVEIDFEDETQVKEQITDHAQVIFHENEKNEKPISYTRLAIYDENENIIFENE